MLVEEPLEPVVSLERAREFLNFDASDTSKDDELKRFLDGITPVVEHEVGPVVVRSATGTVTLGRDGRAALPLQNVLSVTSVTTTSGSSSTTSGVFANGILTARELAGREVTVVCQVGMDPVPVNITYGALEILRIAWASQRRSSLGRGQAGEQPQLPAFLISHRAAAWLRPDSQMHLGFA